MECTVFKIWVQRTQVLIQYIENLRSKEEWNTQETIFTQTGLMHTYFPIPVVTLPVFRDWHLSSEPWNFSGVFSMITLITSAKINFSHRLEHTENLVYRVSLKLKVAHRCSNLWITVTIVIFWHLCDFHRVPMWAI